MKSRIVKCAACKRPVKLYGPHKTVKSCFSCKDTTGTKK